MNHTFLAGLLPTLLTLAGPAIAGDVAVAIDGQSVYASRDASDVLDVVVDFDVDTVAVSDGGVVVFLNKGGTGAGTINVGVGRSAGEPVSIDVDFGAGKAVVLEGKELRYESGKGGTATGTIYVGVGLVDDPCCLASCPCPAVFAGDTVVVDDGQSERVAGGSTGQPGGASEEECENYANAIGVLSGMAVEDLAEGNLETAANLVAAAGIIESVGEDAGCYFVYTRLAPQAGGKDALPPPDAVLVFQQSSDETPRDKCAVECVDAFHICADIVCEENCSGNCVDDVLSCLERCSR